MPGSRVTSHPDKRPVGILMKTRLGNVLLPILFIFVNNIVSIVTSDSGSTKLFNIVDSYIHNYKQCGQQKHCSILLYCRLNYLLPCRLDRIPLNGSSTRISFSVTGPTPDDTTDNFGFSALYVITASKIASREPFTSAK